MRIKIGYDFSYRHFQPTPVVLMTEVHQSRVDDLERLDIPQSEPSVPIDRYFDGFENRCCRLVAPSGDLRIIAETIIKDSGQPDPVVPDAVQHQIQDLPYETLGYLLGSRYCETQLLSEESLFRSDHPDAAASPQDSNAQMTRILASGVANGDVPAADRTYLAQLVSARTGISQADAQKRVDEVIAREKAAVEKAKQAADAARKAAAQFAIFTALSMMIGAFIVSAAAAYGGSMRDEY